LCKKLFCAISVALFLVSFSAIGMAENISTKSDATKQLTVFEDPSVDRSITYIDIPPADKSLGDIFCFNAPLHSENATGPIIGELFGITTIVKMNISSSPGKEQRLAHLVYTFNNKTDQIVVESVSDYSVPLSTLEKNQTVVRPILGGTGNYLGVRGQDVGTRNADGSYTHVLTMFA
jgi:hypothetical protein